MNRWACIWRWGGAVGVCDGCAAHYRRLMRADGSRGVALCRRCHDQYMDIWRAEDAALEAADESRAAVELAIAPELIPDVEEPVRRLRRAA